MIELTLKLTTVHIHIKMLTNAVVPLPDFLKIGSSAGIREVEIEIIIQK